MLDGDNIGWALDDDLRLTRRALGSVVEFTDLKSCDVIHSVWWERLRQMPPDSLNGKRVVCHIPGQPFRYYALPGYSRVAQRVDLWVTQTRQAQQELASLGIESSLIPYAIDINEFRSLQLTQAQRTVFREKWNIPADAYLIGSFQRDTEGTDLSSPKLVKGPDIFLEIVYALHRRGNKIHAILAGPRRFWLKKNLAKRGIPFTFIGQTVEGQDDIEINTLPHSDLNDIYNQIDLYLVSSRSEGGPRAVLEAGSANCKILSTPVGLVLDVLEPACVYRDPFEAVERIERDIRTDALRSTVEIHAGRILGSHVPESNVNLFHDLYACAAQVSSRAEKAALSPKKKIGLGIPNLMRLFKRGDSSLKVSLWHKFAKPPFGGGNQFMLALRSALQSRGIRVIESKIQPNVDAYILNAVWFDINLFRQRKSMVGRRVIHRIDGPISLVRGNDRELDDLCFALNDEFASFTVLQSAWTFQRIIEMGYQPVNPVIIHNAVNPEIFHSRDRAIFDSSRKIRLISSSWSNNPRKGGPVYKWLDQNLNWDRFEYTFVGNASEEFEHIHRIPPVSSEKLADILRQHDVYITASQSDPCSNALIEALACGLPALYLNDGGHPELVGYGGLPFNDVNEIVPQLNRLVTDYDMYQNLIVVPIMDDVVEKYISLLKDTADWET